MATKEERAAKLRAEATKRKEAAKAMEVKALRLEQSIRAKERVAKKREEDKRKIILGSVLLRLARQDVSNWRKGYEAILSNYLTDEDRKLFAGALDMPAEDAPAKTKEVPPVEAIPSTADGLQKMYGGQE